MNPANVRTAQETAEIWSSNPMNRTAVTALTDVEELNSLRRQELHALTLRRMARRAETLWEDGYTASELSRGASFIKIQVTTPDEARYLVTLSDTPDDPIFGDSCTCPAFQKYGDCKHRMACLWAERERAEEERIDREWEQAEECRNFFGFDREDY